MRNLLTGALLLLAIHPIGAQVDSTARRDSLLERERRRIRGEAAPVTVGRDGAERRRRAVALGVGVASGSTWLEGQDGVRVTGGYAPTLAAEMRIPKGRELEYLLGVRASRVGIAVRAAGEYDADPVYVGDAFLGAARTVGGFLDVRGGLVAALVAGGDVAPFTEASRFAPGVELGGERYVTRQGPLRFAMGVQLLRYGAGGDAPTGATAGTVRRIFMELRHVR